MSPIISKPLPPEPHRPEELVALLTQKAKSLLERLLELVEATIVSGGKVVDGAGSLGRRLSLLTDQFFTGSVRLLESYCCLDLQRLVRGPEPKLQGSLPVLFVLMLLMMLYNAFVFAYMPAAGLSLGSRPSVLFHAFVFLVLASFVQAARTNPGEIPKGAEWRQKGQPPPEVKQRKHGSDEARWCRKGEAYKPDRAHYCRVLGRGVLRMDHHCPWLGNTIGFANHKFFFLFLFYAMSACALLGVSIVQLLVHATLPALTTFLLIGAEGLTLLLSFILVPFLCFHSWLLARNMTTIEFCETLREGESSYSSTYDMGLYANVSSVLGANPLAWWLPVGGPMGDGISFPTLQESDPEAEHPHATEAGGFLVWSSAKEFKDDLRLGCEVLGEGLGESCGAASEKVAGAVLRLASLCTGRRHSRRGSGVKPRSGRVVRVHSGGGSSTGGSSLSRASALDFLSD